MIQGYRHLNATDRYTITVMRKSKYSIRDIAKVIGFSPGTISRELKRNSNGQHYRNDNAEHYALLRRKKSRRPSKLTPEVTARLSELLQKKWSPEQISGRLRLTSELNISPETIYRFIAKDKEQGGKLYCHRRHPAKYRRRGSGKKQCIIGRVSIDQRPPEVAAKSRKGDWEIDTVYCSYGPEVLLTLVERVSKFSLIRKLPSRHAYNLATATKYMLARYRKWCNTITADNGTEFACHQKISRETGAAVYFAHPYCSWERGLNENTNGLIRQYVPKSRKGKDVSKSSVRKIQDNLNDRPRKSLDFFTPREILFGKHSVALQS